MTTTPSTTPPSTPDGRLILLRHGETEWSRTRKHTGRSDIPLTERGEDEARRAATLLTEFDVVAAVTSPLRRASHTAELAGLADVRVDDDLIEWDYGDYDGITTAEIRERLGGHPWTVWSDGVPNGETVEEVAARARNAIDRALPDLHRGDVVLVAHAHLLRVLAAVWLEEAPRFGAHLTLASGSVSVLGHEHENPAILRWNAIAPA
ncbi:histidine phosphatase family protein [Agilicoccus flavus]|uniref:histidine phosphatase family protein n=1 Tax=Agilicoccus flavus TaxID=2775968 RepID=UPI001CF61C99|nr:histidine phosphatase family protein [Agilicoccus flavus]